MPNAKELWKTFREEEGSIPRARRSFTGRLEARQAYYALTLQALEDNFTGYYVINYHGIGGIGKSTLLRQLERELLADQKPEKGQPSSPPDKAGELCLAVQEKLGRRKKPVVLRADFDDASLCTPQDVLLRFRAQMMEQASGAMFPLFDLALVRLSQKFGRRVPPNEQRAALIENPVVSFALDAVGDLTGAGLFIKAGQTAVGMAQEVARTLSGLKGCIQRANTEITQMEAPELVRHLPYYFAMDLNAMGLPLLCVYLDTYEKMISRAEGAGRSTGFDEGWLWDEWGLVKNLGNAVFAIAGREPLESGQMEGQLTGFSRKWMRGKRGLVKNLGSMVPDTTDLDPPESDQQKGDPAQVSEFSIDETTAFLTGCGITDDSLHQKLYKLTTGNPLYLDLCAEEYEHLRADGSVPLSRADFAGTCQRLSERYLRYVRPELQDGVRMLCRMGQWTDELYDQLSRHLPQLPREGESGYNDLIHLTYIERHDQGWCVTRSVAEILGQELSDTLFRRLAGTLADIAAEETRRLSSSGNAQAEDGTALNILSRLTTDEPDARAAAVMEALAEVYLKQCELDRARLWQERALEQWKCLEDKLMCLAGWDRLAGILDDMALYQERDETLREGLDLAEELGADAPPDAAVRLWERRARFSAAWEEDAHARKKVLERLQGQGRQNRRLWLAQCRFGRSLGECDEPEAVGLAKDANHGRAQAQALLEEALQELQRLDDKEGRAFSPHALLAAEALCQLLESGGQTERLEEIQARMRGWLPYTVPETGPLEELSVWQEWLDLAMTQVHQQHCGLDMAEMFALQRQVMRGLRWELGEQHAQTLRAQRCTVEAYLISKETVVSGMDELGAELAAEDDPDIPVGSVKRTRLTFFRDTEGIVDCCKELVELYTLYLGREHPATFEVMDLLYRTYDQVGWYDKAADCRLEARRIFQKLRPDQQERLQEEGYVYRMTTGLVDDYEWLEEWEQAVAAQRQLLAQAEAKGGDRLASRNRLLKLYLEWLWQEEALSAREAETLLGAVLEQCGRLGKWDARRYLSSARQWCLTHESKAETETQEAVEAAWRRNGEYDNGDWTS